MNKLDKAEAAFDAIQDLVQTLSDYRRTSGGSLNAAGSFERNPAFRKLLLQGFITSVGEALEDMQELVDTMPDVIRTTAQNVDNDVPDVYFEGEGHEEEDPMQEIYGAPRVLVPTGQYMKTPDVESSDLSDLPETWKEPSLSIDELYERYRWEKPVKIGNITLEFADRPE